jgi:hypothetical protein
LPAKAICVTGQFSAVTNLLTGEERPEEVTEHSPLQPTLVNATAQVSSYAAASGAVHRAYCSNLAEVVEALIVGVGGVREVGGF